VPARRRRQRTDDIFININRKQEYFFEPFHLSFFFNLQRYLIIDLFRQINIKLEFQGEAMLQLTDMNGKIVRQSKIMLHGRASRFLIQTHDLASGAFVCTLVTGDESFSERVIKQ